MGPQKAWSGLLLPPNRQCHTADLAEVKKQEAANYSSFDPESLHKIWNGNRGGFGFLEDFDPTADPSQLSEECITLAIPVNIAVNQVCTLFDGKDGHDVGRFFLEDPDERDITDVPGVTSLAGCAGPRTNMNMTGPLMYPNYGGHYVFLMLQGQCDAVLIDDVSRSQLLSSLV